MAPHRTPVRPKADGIHEAGMRPIKRAELAANPARTSAEHVGTGIQPQCRARRASDPLIGRGSAQPELPTSISTDFRVLLIFIVLHISAY
eukprot:359699-Chlamydomonas_euryale.AAC.7